MGAGAWWHSAAGHSRRVTHGGRSDKELGRQQGGEDLARHLLPPHLHLLVNPLPGAAVRRMTQELCWLWCCNEGMLPVLRAHSPVSKGGQGPPAHPARSAASPQDRHAAGRFSHVPVVRVPGPHMHACPRGGIRQLFPCKHRPPLQPHPAKGTSGLFAGVKHYFSPDLIHLQ